MIVIFLLFISIAHADTFKGSMLMKCDLSIDNIKNPNKMTSKLRYEQFNKFLDSHKLILNTDGLIDQTQLNFEDKSIHFLTIYDSYQYNPRFPDSSALSLSFMPGIHLPQFYIEDDDKKPNFIFESTDKPRLTWYIFKYPKVYSQTEKKYIKKVPQYFMLSFQLNSSKKGMNDIPASFFYEDSKYKDTFSGKCKFLVFKDDEFKTLLED
jgi:hypothetical protein